MDACGVELQAALGQPGLATERADQIPAAVGWPLPCPSRSGRLEAEQYALVPVDEALENALFFPSPEISRIRIR
jgi:hypothetical protein